ncbi:unnamed protein product [Schistocephalus solidus]|uniref:Reverse transcriptase domain-containing protein n=1 Tax=Schistocephalus solidus TaxID=70667 RepID=A0A183SK34_SCHSO|nr:unnamed protein product [Schistocephalus solidus]
MIFAARQLQEKCQETQNHLYTSFVDLMKAFDTVNHDGLWKVTQKFGCPERFMNMDRLNENANNFDDYDDGGAKYYDNDNDYDNEEATNFDDIVLVDDEFAVAASDDYEEDDDEEEEEEEEKEKEDECSEGEEKQYNDGGNSDYYDKDRCGRMEEEAVEYEGGPSESGHPT